MFYSIFFFTLSVCLSFPAHHKPRATRASATEDDLSPAVPQRFNSYCQYAHKTIGYGRMVIVHEPEEIWMEMVKISL